MTAERLQKILARAGVAARRKAEDLMREGRVTVNGRVAVLGEKADPAVDTIKVDDKRIQTVTAHRYLLLNKPRGYLTAVEDDKGRPTVMQLVPQHWRKALIPINSPLHCGHARKLAAPIRRSSKGVVQFRQFIG